MRIVDRKTFLELPEGTIYAKYEPCVFGDVQIKGETMRGLTGDMRGVAIDWYAQDLIPWFQGCQDSKDYFDCLQTIENGVPSPPLDYDIQSRDGLFDSHQKFAVFEDADVKALIERLWKAYYTGYGATPRPQVAV